MTTLACKKRTFLQNTCSNIVIWLHMCCANLGEGAGGQAGRQESNMGMVAWGV